MNLYRLELKRVCKTRMTAILLAIALVLAVVMAYLPVTFIGWTELDASGNKVSYTGLKAIRKRQEQQVSGTITPDVMQEALEAYQRVYRQYDASSINDIPVEVFYKELARYQPLVNNAKEAFADPKTGMAPGVMGLTEEDMLFAQRKILRFDSHLLVSGRQLKNSFKFLILCIGNLSSTNNVFSDCTWKNEVRIEKITWF